MINQKNGYMRIFIQSLTAILLVALIVLAWSINNWFVSLSKKNYAQVTTTQQSKLGNDANLSSLPTTETVIKEMTEEITVQRLEVPHSVESTDTPTSGFIGDNIENSQIKHSQRISETEQNSVAFTVDTQGTESQLTLDELTAEAPTTDLEKLSLTALDSIDPPMPPTEEDSDYLQALREQFSDRGQKTEKLSDEQLAKLVKHKLGDLVDNRSREDGHNKAYVVSKQEGDNATGNTSELKLQKKVEALVLSSLKELAKERLVSPPSKHYLESLEKEAETRINEMRIIVVQPGDSLSKIALRAYGNGHLYMKIFEANHHLGSDPNLIHVGQVLRVPL